MTSLAAIKAVSFDMDGTLWDFAGVMRRSLGEVLKEIDMLDPDAAAMLSVDRMIKIEAVGDRPADVALVVSKPVAVTSLREALAEVAPQ